MMRWVVQMLISYHEQDFVFDNASDAEAFAKIAHDTMLPYSKDEDGAPKMAEIKIMAEFIEKEEK